MAWNFDLTQLEKYKDRDILILLKSGHLRAVQYAGEKWMAQGFAYPIEDISAFWVIELL